jgi:hypothetical protein
MSFEPFLIGFLLGAVVGALFIVFALKPQSHECPSNINNSVNTPDLNQLMMQQLAYQQYQNQLRELQLAQARNNVELQNLNPIKTPAVTLTQYDLDASVKYHLAKQQQGLISHD